MRKNKAYWKSITLAVLAVGTAVSLFSRFRAGNAFLAFFEDDYFYYLRIAQHIALGHGSTYDGSHLTNGYHPLWMLVNVGLAKLFAGHTFFYMLLAVIELCVLATFYFLELTFRRYAGDALASGLAGILAVQGLELMAGGMEIVLTVTLFALLAWYRICRFDWTLRSAAIYGLICSALILSRLDTILFLILLGILELLSLVRMEHRSRRAAIPVFLLALLPVICYFLFNHFALGAAMPVSGQAKQLRLTHQMSWTAIHQALLAWMPLRLFLVIPVLCAVVPAAVQLCRACGDPLKSNQSFLWALIAFPFLEFIVLGFVSDWPFWPWYLYPLFGAAIGLCLTFLMSGHQKSKCIVRSLVPISFIIYVGLLGTFSLVEWRNARRPNLLIYTMYNAAVELQEFAHFHPGVYAMGDRAGIVGMLVNQTIVQMEGLTMDEDFLSNIRQNRDLHDVLRKYGVRYYVATNPKRMYTCLISTEPLEAGPTSHVMHGTFCSTPVDRFQFGGYTTYVFDMEKESH